jgi:hypothetical protein
MRTTYGDVKFSDVLLRPLEPGEDPAAKLPALYEALGVEDERAAVLELARIFLPGFKLQRRQKKKAFAGRPSLLSRICAANGHTVSDLPSWFAAEFEERLFARMESIVASGGRRIKAEEAAYQLIGERKWNNRINLFYVDLSIAPKTRNDLATSIVYLFTHRKGRRRRYGPELGRYNDHLQQIREMLKPHLPWIAEEALVRLSHAAAQRRAAGKTDGDIAADIKVNGSTMLLKTFDEVIRESFL